MKRVIVIIATLIMGQAFAATNHYSEIRGVDVTNYEISMNFTKFLITRIDPILVETTLSVKITDDMDQLELNFNHQASKVLKVQELTSHLELPYKLDYYSFDNRYGFINISFNRKLLAGEEVKVKIFTEFHPWLYTFLPSGGYSSTWSGVADIPFSCSNSGDYCKLKTYRHNFRSIFPSHDHFSDTASFKFNFVVAKKKEDSNYYATAAGSLVGGRYSELSNKYTWIQPEEAYTSVVSFDIHKNAPIYEGSVTSVDGRVIKTHMWNFDECSGDTTKDCDQKLIDLMSKDLPNALSTLENMFGPYPYSKIGFMQTNGGMEYLSISKTDYSLRTFVHEFVHAWWGNTLRPAWYSGWISEGYATYWESLVKGLLRGKSHEESLNFINKWSLTQPTSYKPDGRATGCNNCPISMLPSDSYGSQQPQALLNYRDGASFIHVLRRYTAKAANLEMFSEKEIELFLYTHRKIYDRFKGESVKNEMYLEYLFENITQFYKDKGIEHYDAQTLKKDLLENWLVIFFGENFNSLNGNGYRERFIESTFRP